MDVPNYVKLIAAINRRRHDEIQEMEQVHFTVNHDHDCGRYTGAGRCTCNSDSIEISEEPPGTTG